MGEALADGPSRRAGYIAAWQGVGRGAEREHQIGLTLRRRRAAHRVTRLPLLRKALGLMRGPAQAAGLGELQRTLESGFDIFRAMKGAEEFTAFIAEGERALAEALFAAGPRSRRGRGGDGSWRWRPCRRRRAIPTDRAATAVRPGRR